MTTMRMTVDSLGYTGLMLEADGGAPDDANDSGTRTARGAQTSARTAMTSQLPGIENVDHTDRALKLATVNTAYRAALRTTASIGQVSLLDFLR